MATFAASSCREARHRLTSFTVHSFRQLSHCWPEGARASHRTLQQTTFALKSMQESYECPIALAEPADASVTLGREMEEEVEAALCSMSLEAPPALGAPSVATDGPHQCGLEPLDWSTLLLNVQGSQGLHDVDNLNNMLYGLRKETQRFTRRSKTQACSSRGSDSVHAVARKSKVLQKHGRRIAPRERVSTRKEGGREDGKER